MIEQSQSSLYHTFLRDGDTYLHDMNRDLLELEQSPNNAGLIDRLFRSAHSLKSEADYLDLSEIASEAHRIETALDAIRANHGAPLREQFDQFFACIDRIHEMMDLLKVQNSKDNATTGTPAPDRSEREEASGDTTGHAFAAPTTAKGRQYPDALLPDLSNFEKVLLRESLQREEAFFKISVEIDENSPMPYAKAYLILSNLEQLVNVIHSQPAFGLVASQKIDQSIFLNPVFFCTGSVSDRELYKAVNVDQVKRILISPLEYETVLEGAKRDESQDEYQPNYTVQLDGADLDDLNAYVDELKIRVHRLRRDIAPRASETSHQLSLLTDLVKDLELFTRRISMVQLSDILQHHSRLIRDQARKLNKEVELELVNCDINIDRRAAELISDMTLHLLRNAVVHGIEPPFERNQAHKSSKGRVSIEAAMQGDQLQITVSDDGAGIDIDQVRDLAYKRGMKVAASDGECDMEHLLEYLIQPGLSTQKSADSHSGRGYGLDLVNQKVQQFEGVRLEMETTAGKGTSFRLTLPSGFSILSLTIVRYKNHMYAVPTKNVEEEVEVSKEHFQRGENGELLWNGMNVFSPEGRLFFTDSMPDQTRALVLSYGRHRALLLLDEVLFHKEVPEDSLTLYIAGSPYVHKMDLYGAPSEIFYLSPSIVAV